MRVKLVWIEQDFRGNHLSKREELLDGEAAENFTRNHVARLIARHHPELHSAGSIMLDALEDPYKWYVKAIQQESNRWVYVYAERVDEVAGNGCIGTIKQPPSMLTVNRILQVILGTLVAFMASEGRIESDTAGGVLFAVAFVGLIAWLIVDIFWPDPQSSNWLE